eukprot:TRINITY_DN71382_c0_g1_i1.p1 TRINITY_DN71382_c0_g1~~TRINITY_DN71382_c0_g1_i1.p1  ORF type:complete len:1052 (+),score=293.52 TRINITY_DN71382_c0_g1_i1:258-3413(+)
MKRGHDEDLRSSKRSNARPSAAPRDDHSDNDSEPGGRRGRHAEGRIRFFDKNKGFGFLESPEASGDIFCPRQSLPKGLQDMHPEDLKGMEVSFSLYFTDDGKPRADHVQRVGRGDSPGRRRGREAASGSRGSSDRDRDRGRGSSSRQGHGDLETGEVVNFDDVKGYGFIRSDRGGEDVFFLKPELPGEFRDRPREAIGRAVEFEPFVADGGKRRARHLVMLSNNRGGGGGVWREGGRAGGGNRLILGRIARWDRQKGYGFINSVDSPEDVFFLPSALPPELMGRDDIVGADVEVEVFINEEGKPRAKRMSLAPRHGGPPRGGPPPPPPQAGMVDIHYGEVVNFDPAKGFGFIHCGRFAEDLWFQRGELPPELQHVDRREKIVGARVEFEVKAMPDGKMRAQRILLQPQGHGGPPPPPMMMHAGPPPPPAAPNGPVGYIRRFDKAKGYGFITTNSHKDDIFFLPSALPKDIDLNDIQGMEVSLEFYISEDGKPRASKVRPRGRQPPPAGFPGGFVPPGPPPPPGAFMPMGPPPMGPPMAPPPPMSPMFMPPMPPPMAMQGMPGMPGMPPQGRFAVGTVCRWDTVKGFGFIEPDPGLGLPEDVFCLKGELPPELKEAAEVKDRMVGQRLEFELVQKADGKLRARACVLYRGGRGGGGAPAASSAGGGKRKLVGKIRKFEVGKGYGFLECPDVAASVFFLKSVLPKDMQEIPPEDLKDMEVAFELGMNEEGKPRANNITAVQQPAARDGEVLTATILRYDLAKTYGFLRPDDIEEDVYFQRCELPPELQDIRHKDDIEQQRVEFEVKTMPDGKMRAVKITLLEGGPPRAEREADEREVEVAPLDDALVGEMEVFLEDQGGGCNYGAFSQRFQKVKRKQLEEHFMIVEDGNKKLRIELRDGHPGKRARDASADEDMAEPAEDMDEEEARAAAADDPEPQASPEGSAGEAAGDVAEEEPAILPGPGCNPQGFIRQYNAEKGFGFVTCEGFEGDIYFPRQALPELFRGRNAKEMPALNGVAVAVDLIPNGDRGPRAERVTLLLKWHTEDKCWLLRRH